MQYKIMQTNTGIGWVWYLLAGESPNASFFWAPVSDDTAWVWRDIACSGPEGEDCTGMGWGAGCAAPNDAGAVSLDVAADAACCPALDAAAAAAAGTDGVCALGVLLKYCGAGGAAAAAAV